MVGWFAVVVVVVVRRAGAGLWYIFTGEVVAACFGCCFFSQLCLGILDCQLQESGLWGGRELHVHSISAVNYLAFHQLRYICTGTARPAGSKTRNMGRGGRSGKKGN